MAKGKIAHAQTKMSASLLQACASMQAFLGQILQACDGFASLHKLAQALLEASMCKLFVSLELRKFHLHVWTEKRGNILSPQYEKG